MNEASDQQNNQQPGIPIPRVFYDSIGAKPFETCQVCEKPLLETNADYIIEKVYRKNIATGKIEAFFEYAICFDCAMKLTSSYSKKSKENLQRYFLENINASLQQHQHKELKDELEVQEHLSRCAITGKQVTELDEYQLIGQFSGKHMKEGMMPYMISADSMDTVSDLLSEETLGEIDDFTGKYLTGPPEFRDFFKSPKRRPILV